MLSLYMSVLKEFHFDRMLLCLVCLLASFFKTMSSFSYDTCLCRDYQELLPGTDLGGMGCIIDGASIISLALKLVLEKNSSARILVFSPLFPKEG